MILAYHQTRMGSQLQLLFHICISGLQASYVHYKNDFPPGRLPICRKVTVLRAPTRSPQEVPNMAIPAHIHLKYMLGCVSAVGRAFYAACSTWCAREVSVVHDDLRLLGCKAASELPTAES